MRGGPRSSRPLFLFNFAWVLLPPSIQRTEGQNSLLSGPKGHARRGGNIFAVTPTDWHRPTKIPTREKRGQKRNNWHHLVDPPRSCASNHPSSKVKPWQANRRDKALFFFLRIHGVAELDQHIQNRVRCTVYRVVLCIWALNRVVPLSSVRKSIREENRQGMCVYTNSSVHEVISNVLNYWVHSIPTPGIST